MKKTMSQNQRIAQYIRDFGSISPIEAMADLGVLRLSARIYDLRHKLNMSIKTTTETSRNRYGEPVRYARYSLEEDTE